MKALLTKKTCVVFIIAFAAVTVLAIVTLSSGGLRAKLLGRPVEGPSYLIDYGAAEPQAAHEDGHDHEHADGHTGEHNHVPVLDAKLIEAFTFHPERGEKCRITYSLPEPALVSIKVQKMGTRELYLATIVNSEFRDKGEHTETWDGRDYSGNIVDMSQATITVGADKPSQPGTMALDTQSPEQVVHGHEWGHDHGAHHAWAEEVPFLKVTNIKKDTVLSGKVRIEVEVDKDKRGYGNQYGYGVRYYVDNTLAHEEFYKPECDGQFAYEFDTTAFPNGKHMLYIGMCDHNQHTTSASVPVVFDN